MAFFDTHAHLSSKQFAADREQVIARAHSAGVVRVLTCGSDLTSSQSEVSLAQSAEGLYAAVGVHAHHAAMVTRGEATVDGRWQTDEAIMAQLGMLATQPRVVAVGEVGLDYHYDFSPRPVQRAVLSRQLILAHDLGLPVVLHSRESDDDLRSVVEAAPGPLRGVWHCFLSDHNMAGWALAMGLHLGIGGPITFRNAGDLREAIRRVPLERLLIETDCPYLAPHPHRGHRNEPAYVVHVAEALARLHSTSLDEVARRTTDNAHRLFGTS